MRSRRQSQQQAAEVARRRLELLSAELAAIRPDPMEPPSHEGPGGSGEPSISRPAAPTPSPPMVSPPALAPPALAPSVPDGRGRHALRPVAAPAAVGGWLADRMPARFAGRVRIGAAHLAAVAVVVAAAMALLAWTAVRAADPGDLVPARAAPAADPESTPAALVSPVGVTSGGPGAADASPGSGASAGEVVVDVAGKVRRPGIVRLPPGSRVVDAVEAAGGPRRGVNLTSLNLARLLVDGEQIVVGVPVPPGVAASAASAPTAGAGSGPLVNINTASQTELETLPGIGPVTAAAIVQWRTDNGPFSAVDELMEVSGIGEATLADVAPFVTL